MRTLKADFLAWFGVIGAALTLFGQVGPLLQLADWCRYFVTHWAQFIRSTWRVLFSWLPVEVPHSLSTSLTLSFFIIAIAVGGRLAARASGQDAQIKQELLPVSEAFGEFNRWRWSKLPIVLLVAVYAVATLLADEMEGVYQQGLTDRLLWCAGLLPSFLAVLILPEARLNARIRLVLVGALLLVGLNFVSLYGPHINSWLTPPATR